MNIDAEIPSEILANKIQATCKKDTPRSYRIIHNHNPEMQGWFSIWESINFPYYANRIKGRNHIITSIDTVKYLMDFETLSVIKMFNKLGVFPKSDKVHAMKNPQVAWYLIVKDFLP